MVAKLRTILTKKGLGESSGERYTQPIQDGLYGNLVCEVLDQHGLIVEPLGVDF